MYTSKLAGVTAVLCAMTVWGCNGTTQDSTAAGNESAIHGSKLLCKILDKLDSLPDGIDEDCDGAIDEDADFNKKMCPPGTNIILGTAGDDMLQGTNKADCILGFGGNDTISGGNGADFIAGGPGDDKIYSGSGADVVYGGKGNDYIDSANGGDCIVYGGDGADTLLGGNGADGMYGGDGNDVMIGGNGPDLMQGGGCHDLILGEKGPDVATGGKGFDACDGELSIECEKNKNNKVDCHVDADCGANAVCAQNVGFCVPKTAEQCNDGCIATASTDTTCDGVDDDCDGQKDEDFVASMTSCGAGACHATGATSCVDGAVVDSCVAGTPAASDDNCNGIDDNCNGLIDEDYASIPTSCGVGACHATGMTSCVGGHVQSSCMPGAPAADDASCDGVDDDCDERVDENYVSVTTSCGLGVCQTTGSSSCVDGHEQSNCAPASATGSDNDCNGIDEDCDGSADEDYASHQTSCGSGACVNSAASTCVAGHEQDNCVVTCEGSCGNMSDDDNDGAVDCADSDCAADSACQAATNSSIGHNCTNDGDCGPGGVCETGFPGGYCYVPCDFSQPAGQECQAGSFCWLGAACVLPCGAGNTCSDSRLTCGDFSSAGLGNDPFCHPTCMESCVNGAQCDPQTSLCF
jgi:hypothetical protein